MQSPASYGCAWTISDRPRAEQSRRGVSSSGVSAQGRGPSMFAWKATTKTSLAQKARAPKRSLARKEILFSAVRLTVDLSPFLQLTLLQNWQSLTASALPDRTTYMQIMFKVLHSSLTCTQPIHHWACLWKLYTKEKYAKHKTEKKKEQKINNWAVQTTEKGCEEYVRHYIRKAQASKRKQVVEWKKALL